MEWEQHIRGEESAAMGNFVGELEAAIKKETADNRHNRECFPLYPRGYKDADLDACGCTGIRKVLNATEDYIEFEVGGHKVISPVESDNENEPVNDALQELVCDCGYPGEWDGDYWVVSFKATLRVDWTFGENLRKAAKAVVKQADALLQKYENDMTQLDADADQIIKLFENEAA